MRLTVVGVSLIALNILAAISAPDSLAGYTPWLGIFPLVGVFAAFCFAIFASRYSKHYLPECKSVWRYIILATGLSLVGNALLAYNEFYLGNVPIYPSLSDILQLLAYLPISRALFLAARQAPTNIFRTKSRLQQLPLAVIVLLLLGLWLPPLFTLIPLAEKIISGTTLLLDILLAVGIWAVYQAWPFNAVKAWRHPWLWLATGTIFILLADISFSYTFARSIFNPALELLWLLAYSAWIWAAVLFMSSAANKN